MVRRLRLATGLVLFAFVATHLANHSLGLVSLETMEAGRQWFLLLWRNPAATTLLYGALFGHLALNLWSLSRRRTLRMPAWEAWQILLGLAVPVLLAEHLLGTRVLHEFYGVEDAYTYVILVLWVFQPVAGLRQALLLFAVWTHGCLGLHYWLRLKPWYRRIAPYACATALLVPTLALLGFARAGRELALLARDEAWLQATAAALKFPDAEAVAFVGRGDLGVAVGFAALLALIMAMRRARLVWDRRRGTIYLTYPNGRRVAVVPGATILETSRHAGIAHASMCGGRARCSTCRVRINRGLETLPPPSPHETHILKSVGAPANVRLACQVRPTKDLEVTPLPPTATPCEARARSAPLG
ncbi:MAG: 2Fe-2S iron-sulfur cluster-binding protein [Alphaproteobacteria bacterium]